MESNAANATQSDATTAHSDAANATNGATAPTATRKLFIVGHPVAHSKSPAMYNALYQKANLAWHYDFADLATHDEARAFLAQDTWLSVNVTTPYKPDAYEAATIKAATAQLAKGVNLLVHKNGEVLGFNVDGDGCVRFLEREGVSFRECKAVVCGTGPTATSIVHALAGAGAREITLLGRDKERASRIMRRYADDYRHLARTAIPMPAPQEGHLGFVEAYEHVTLKFGSYETSKRAIQQADVIIDATTLGMAPGDPAPFDTTLLSQNQVIMDTVYGHETSALIAAAQKLGCRAFDGAGMLVAQAVISATIVCEVMNVELQYAFDELFDIMANAAGFTLD